MTATANQFGHWRTGYLATGFIGAGATANNRTQRDANSQFPRFEWTLGMQYRRSRPWSAFGGHYHDWLTSPALTVSLLQSLDGVLARQLAVAAALGAAVQARSTRDASLDAAAALAASGALAIGGAVAAGQARGNALDAAAAALRATTSTLGAAIGARREGSLAHDAALAQSAFAPFACDGALKASLAAGIGIDAALAGLLTGFGGRGLSVPPRGARTRPSGVRASAPGARDTVVTLPDGRTLVVPPGNRRN